MSESKIERRRVRLADLQLRYTRATNPNVMPGDTFDALVAFIKRVGFIDPPLVTEHLGVLTVQDGHHRCWAAGEAGLEEIEVDVFDGPGDTATELIALGMNHLRGDLDYSAVARVLAAAQESDALTLEELAGLSAFDAKEITAMLEDASPVAEQVMREVEEVADKGGKTFVLELVFDTLEDLKTAKRRLRKASGATKNMAHGLMKVLGEK